VRRIGPAFDLDKVVISELLVLLWEAGTLLRRAGADRAYKPARRAFDSTEGANRYAGHHIYRMAA
jgi:hypothetical protein